MKRKFLILLAILAATCCGTLTAAADTINAEGIYLVGGGNHWSYTGVISYATDSPTSATVTVDLTNTSTTAASSYLTGFYLHIPGNRDAAVSLAANANGFHSLGAPSFNASLSPFGGLNLIAGSLFGTRNGDRLHQGLAPGATGTFTFTITEGGFDTSAALGYPRALFSQVGAGGGNMDFIARFSGSEGNLLVPGGEQPLVPIPPTALLLGSGLLGLAGFRLFRKN